MKMTFPILLLFPLVLYSFRMNAQQVSRDTRSERMASEIIAQVAEPLPEVHEGAGPVSRRTRAASRLIGTSGAVYGTAGKDTAALFYGSGAYGYDPTERIMQFGPIEEVLWMNALGDPAVMLGNAPDKIMSWTDNGALALQDSTLLTFDVAHRLIRTETNNPVTGIRKVSVFSYNVSGLVSEFIDSIFSGATLSLVKRKQFGYTAQGHLNMVREEQYNLPNSQWDPIFCDSLFYDGQNRAVRQNYYSYNQATSQWLPTIGYRYAYDGSGWLSADTMATWTGSGWLDNYANSYQRDISGRLLCATGSSYSGSNWGLNHKDSLAYSGADPYPSVRLSLNYNNGVWDFSQMHRYRYNAFSQVTEDSSFNYSAAGAIWNYAAADWYYYEPYSPSSATTRTKGAEEFTVYPQPAGDQVRVKYSFPPTYSMVWKVYSSDGRPMVQGQWNPSLETILDIDLRNLPAGLYWLMLQGEKRSTVRSMLKY